MSKDTIIFSLITFLFGLCFVIFMIGLILTDKEQTARFLNDEKMLSGLIIIPINAFVWGVICIVVNGKNNK